MPKVQPFRAISYSAPLGAAPPHDLSAAICPPYDVLDLNAKKRLLERNSRNIVAIDLPHVPPKGLGPVEAYQDAARTLDDWLALAILREDTAPAMFVYRQTFASGDATRVRTGMACTIAVQPFGPRDGGGILPHEETFSGPKQDRLALMKATQAQMSPIFALHADDSRNAHDLLQRIAASRTPNVVATGDDGVLHELWRVDNAADIQAYQNALLGQDVLIADGHHRYNTALNYLQDLSSAGAVPADHPARQCLVVLVSMNDPGLEIWPTHRVLGGMSNYSLSAFKEAAGDRLAFTPIEGGLAELEAAVHAPPRDLSSPSTIRVGLWDVESGASFLITPTNPDPLNELHGYKPPAWRNLDVAFIQHVLVEEIFQPKLNDDAGVQWAFPHTLAEVEALARGESSASSIGKPFKPQVALIIRPTPLAAVRELALLGELMPQKSTFFYPKLATGLFLRRVRA